MDAQVRQFLAAHGYCKTVQRMKKTSEEAEELFTKFETFKRSQRAKTKSKSKLSFEVSFNASVLFPKLISRFISMKMMFQWFVPRLWFQIRNGVLFPICILINVIDE